LSKILEYMNIRELSLEEIKTFLTENGEKAFRAKQVYEWLWKKNVNNYDEMTNLSKSLRDLLKDKLAISTIQVFDTQKSKDGTTKIAFKLQDGLMVEGVLIPSAKRATACISCQAGCALGCAFCATGKLGFKRDLTASEIYEQIYYIKTLAEKEGYSFSNIVYMGMGEPLLNYDNVLESINKVTGKDGLEMSASRITVSTAGLPEQIRRLADDEVKFNLAISLHSALNEVRNTLMPINKKFNLTELSEAIKYFVQKTDSRPTFEYLLINDVNDSLSAARALADFCRAFPVKINIIEYNPTENDKFKKSSKERLDGFVKVLEGRNMIVNVRQSKGKDIDAACGQLANKKSE
jgi:23S rRNA (adenine2503-C2)-methyltransferase